MNSQRSGVTLMELLVVLAILATIAAVTGLAARRLPAAAGKPDLETVIAQARGQAVQNGHSVTIVADSTGREITAFADGSVASDVPFVDPLSGRLSRAP